MKFALRQLLKSPGFTLVAVLSLALGIGANTTIFSLVNEVLLKSLPVRAPEQLVLFSWSSPRGLGPQSINGWSLPDPVTGWDSSTSLSRLTYERLRDAKSPLLAEVFAFAPLYRLNVVVNGQAEVVSTGQVASGNYHAALGVPLALGRGLKPEDDLPSAAPVVVISHRYWQRQFAGDPAVIGKTLTANGVAAAIVGVTGPQFAGTLQVGEMQDLTLPLSAYPLLEPTDTDAPEPWCWWLRIMARTVPGATREQLAGALTGIFHESIRNGVAYEPRSDEAKAAKPPDYTAVRFHIASGSQGLTEARRTHTQSLGILTGLVALVLLVACANVANLLLARGAARQREFAVRLALGASRSRVLAQLLAESVLLGLLGGLAGLLVAVWGRDALLALQPLGRSANMLELPLDWRVLGFTTAVAVGTGVLFGLAPAWRATRLDLAAGFAGGPRTLGGNHSRLARGLMVVQVALSLVLLVGAGLFTRTLINLQRMNPGFDQSGLLLGQVDAMAGGRKRAELPAFYDGVAERFAALPGVVSVTYSQVPTLSGSSWTTYAKVAGFTPPPGKPPLTLTNGVSPDFFRTFGIPLTLGRAFTAADGATAPKVAIVNQTFAAKFFGDQSPLGQRISTGEVNGEPDTEIVGVARDVVYTRLREKPMPMVYRPYAQLRNAASANFALRVAGDPESLAPSLYATLRAIDPTLPLNNVRTQAEQIDRGIAGERMFAGLASGFGLLALILAGIGLYGLLSYTVVRRTGEIGLRLALGALPRRVLWMVVRESLVLVAAGVVIGGAAAFGIARLVASRFFGLTPSDPATYVATTALLLGVAVAAALLPARRAAKVDPMVALRTE